MPPYRGSTAQRPRRGVICTQRRAIGDALAHIQPSRRGVRPPAAAVLLLDEHAYSGVPCWTGGWARWSHVTVALAYDISYPHIQPLLCDGGIARKTLINVAAAMAAHADYGTGRHCRASNDTLARHCGVSIRTVQRAKEVLRLLGVATEVLRGRLRTRVERFASWRVGDRARGWASVWALHDNVHLIATIHSLSPHPEGSLFSPRPHVKSVLTTANRRPDGRRHGAATRHPSPDEPGQRLAKAWRAHPNTPAWAQRHSCAAWARLLASPARHQWTPRDLNTLIADWLATTGRTIPQRPHKPIGLLGTILAWHGPEQMMTRPAALDEARERAELALSHQRIAAAAADHQEHLQARKEARAALEGPGHAWARSEVRRLAQHSRARRTEQTRQETAARDAAVAKARGQADTK